MKPTTWRMTVRAFGAALITFTLAACSTRPAGPITVPSGTPPSISTSSPITGPTTAPSATPITSPTTAPSAIPITGGQGGALVGPEWTVAAQGDFDRNGAPDVIAYKPATIRTSVDPGTVDFATVVSEAVLVERQPDGTPRARVFADAAGLRIDGGLVIPFATRPAAMLLKLIGAQRQVLLTPLDGAGQQFTYDVGAVYDSATASYSRLGGEISGGRPLIGPEWTTITTGDFDRNGRTDVVAYKPAAIASQVSTENGFLASEIVIVERQPDGAPATRLLITYDGVIADNTPIASFGTGDYRPAAMIVRLFGAERKLVLTQLNRAGQQYAQDVAVGYVEVQEAYAVYGPGGTLPFPLVGPEWTLAANGSLTPNVRDGAIAYKPATVPASNLGPGDFAVVVSELVVVDRGASGGPVVRLAVTLDAITADGQVIARFGSGALRPAGLIARGSFRDRSITFSPVDSGGQPYAQDARVAWDSAAQAYRVTGPGSSQPPEEFSIGPEWKILERADRNGDGKTDAVIYTPASQPVSVPPGASGIVANEVAIVQNNSGGTEYMVSVAQGAIYAGGYLIYTFSDGSGGPLPAGYLVRSDGDVVVVTALTAEGAPSGSAVAISWQPSTGTFTAAPR